MELITLTTEQSITERLGYLLHTGNKMWSDGVYFAEKSRIGASRILQGVVLAVTLFLVAINDVFDILPAGIYPLVYADDIVLVVTGKSTYRIRKKTSDQH